ncbi:MAG: DsbA family protein [Arenicellales bacterium]
MTSRIRKFAALASLALGLALSPVLHAQTSGSSGGMSDADKAKLEQEIVKDVIQELKSSGALQDAVQQGIHDFVMKQQQARVDAYKKQQEEAAKLAEHVRPVSVKRDHIYGNPDAKISLISYSDFECPFCKRFYPTSKELVDKSHGEVNLVYRHFPLPMHEPSAREEAEASECATELGGNDAFWAYADAIFKRTKSNGNGFPHDQLVPLAVQIGLDKTKFKDCLDSGRQKERVESDEKEGQRIGISGTPGNIVRNNKTGKALVRTGAQPLDVLMDAVKTLTKGDDQKDSGQS